MAADAVQAVAKSGGKDGAREQARGLVEVVLAMALAGSSVVAGKLLSTRVPVFLSVELSLCAALAAILPVQVVKRRELRLLGRGDLLAMFLQALFGIVLFRVFTLYGLRFTTASSAGIITSAAPAVMAVLAAVFLGEKLGRRPALGVALTIGGVLAINLWGGAGGSGGSGGAGGGAGSGPGTVPGWIAGNLLVLAATVCEALLTIFRKRTGGRIGSITNTTLLVTMSGILLLPFAIADLRRFPLSAMDPVAWAAVLYYGAVATVIAYILWGHGAVRIPAHRTGIATAALPVTAVLLSAIVLAEPLRPVHVAGCAAVIAGVLMGAL